MATLSYHYGRRTVWIGPLTAERVPSDHDHCRRHTARLGVPKGWALEDLRTPTTGRPAYTEPTSLAG